MRNSYPRFRYRDAFWIPYFYCGYLDSREIIAHSEYVGELGDIVDNCFEYGRLGLLIFVKNGCNQKIITSFVLKILRNPLLTCTLGLIFPEE